MILGKYSGRIYEENEIHAMEECGICITDEQAKDEDWISIQKRRSVSNETWRCI